MERPDGDGKTRNENVGVLFKGLLAIAANVGTKSVYGLSASPYHLSGSG